MYEISEVLASINADPTAYVLAAAGVFGLGFMCYISALVIQLRDRQSPFYAWQHAWYFAHDFAFVLLFDLWFNVVDFWLFKLMWGGCIVFVIVELVCLYQTIKYERNEVWGKYYKSGKVTVAQGWIRGLAYYAVATALFLIVRAAIGDIMCLCLMSSTIILMAFIMSFKTEEMGSRKGNSVFLAIFCMLQTAFAFLPQGLGFFTSSAAVFREPWFMVLGAISLVLSVRYLVIILRFPSKKNLISTKNDTEPKALKA